MAALSPPPLESMTVDEARAFTQSTNSRMRPPGPDVGEIVDGTLPGAAGRAGVSSLPTTNRRAAPDHCVLPRWGLGSWEMPHPTIRCAVTSVCEPTQLSCQRTTATRPSTVSPAADRRRDSPQLRVDRPNMPLSWAGYPDSLRSVDGAPAADIAAVVCQTRARYGRTRNRWPSANVTCGRLRHDSRFLHRKWRRLHPYRCADAVVFRRTTPTQPTAATVESTAARRGSFGPPTGDRGDLRVRSPSGRGRCLRRRARGGGRSVTTTCPRAWHTLTSHPRMVDVVISGAPVRAQIADALRQFTSARVWF